MGGVVQEWGMRSEAQQGLDAERRGQDPYWVWHQYSGGTGRNRWPSRTLESSRVQEPVPGKLQLRFMQWGRVNIKHSTDPEGSRTQELVAETLNLWDSSAVYFKPLISASSVLGNDCKIAPPWLVQIVYKNKIKSHFVITFCYIVECQFNTLEFIKNKYIVHFRNTFLLKYVFINLYFVKNT